MALISSLPLCEEKWMRLADNIAKPKIVSSFVQAVLNILEPHLKGCQPPEMSDTYSSTWESMDSGNPTEASSSTNVTTPSTRSRDSKVTTIEMTSTLLPR